MGDIFNIEKQIYESTKDLPDENYMLGRTLLQPFKPANSGSRALMSSIHAEHFMVLSNGEVPIVQTGFETEFGENSTSYVASDANYKVLHKINKFSFNNNHYYLIIQNIDTEEYDVIERITYNHNTQSYGYMWDNSRLDEFHPGSIIHKGEVIKTSRGFEEYGNKMNGVNLLTLYLSCAQNMEDSIIISETAAKKLETNLIKSTSITINDNDILLNLYGDNNTYKTFPDIGERVQNGIFCSIRRVENNNILFSLSQARQRDIMISDRNILLDGYVCDIDVYCNTDTLGDSEYNAQLYKYYNEKLNFCQQVNDYVGPLDMNGKLSYNLKKLYSRCRDAINGKEYYKEKTFNNVIMEVTVMQPLPMQEGDKAADRYGGKGIVSQILPDDQMPILDNGQRIEIIKNQSTCINRENIGQLHEQSLNFIGMRFIDAFRSGQYTYTEMCNMWYELVSMVDKPQADLCKELVDFNDEFDAKTFIDSILMDDAIIFSTPPFTTPINIDTIRQIYDKFPWVKPCTIKMPIRDSNDNLRFVDAKRKLIVGKIYNYRLKQYAEEKFSVTSLSATNLKNLNTRSKANKIYETKYTKTPIMFGAMESGNLAHLGMQYVVMNLMLYSSSPQGRRLFEELLIGNPYDIDIKLDNDSKNRNAEIINSLLKTMGLRLVFEKHPKQVKRLIRNILYKTIPNKDWRPKTNLLEIIGDDMFAERLATEKIHHNEGKKLYKRLMTRGLNEDGSPHYETNIRKIIEEYDREINSDESS